MTGRAYTFSIPLPPRELSPNARTHWATRAKAKRKYRQTCGLLMLSQSRGDRPMFNKARVVVEWFARDRRGLGLDDDNRLASLKAAFDALQDAGIVVDDCGCTYELMPVEVDRHEPRVVLVVEGKR